MTISEYLFERFCDIGGIAFARLPAGNDVTADYEIILCGMRVIVEIKELAPNEEEQQVIREYQEKHSAGWGDTIRKRVRYKIDAAKRQLERLAAGQCPGVLLLYDARPAPFNGIAAHDIKAAMYGFESIDLHVPEKLGEPVRFGAHRFGKGKKFRRDCHTYISAIGVLWERRADGYIHIDLFHNIYAECLLPFAGIVARKDMTAYTLAPGKGNEIRGWAKMVSDEEYREANKASADVGV
jgi:hypothetical protein